MVRITEELVRKKSEHNECIISTLEELSLHQEDVEKIEHLGNWCKNLEILYLQANLISKIENLQKLKKLKYLNLAINNIEKVENLEKCESLEKLDLTLNFIGDITSVSSLKNNTNLRHLYLTGNPLCEYSHYKEYIIAILPQLESLDTFDITRSEKIKAQQILEKIAPRVVRDQEIYKKKRQEQIRRLAEVDNDIPDEEFWHKPSENAPETRMEISKRQRKTRGKDEKKEKPKKEIKVYDKNGKPLNINQAKLEFSFDDADPKEFVLDIAVYKYLDTSFIDVDVQPIYVRVNIKGKIFQFVLSEEVYTNKSTAQRSQITGHLVIRMPKVSYDPKLDKSLAKKTEEVSPVTSEDEDNTSRKHVFLEICPANDSMDFSKITEVRKNGKTFQDNDEVPPLEYS